MGVDDDGQPIEVVDRLKDDVIAAARAQRSDPLSFLRNRELFGDLVDDERFTSAYVTTLDSLHSKGARKSLEDLMAGRRR